MTAVGYEAASTSGVPFARMRSLAGEAEALAPVDPGAARVSLAGLRDAVAGLSNVTASRQVAGLLRIVDTLDTDLATGGVRSITGLARQVNRLERLGL